MDFGIFLYSAPFPLKCSFPATTACFRLPDFHLSEMSLLCQDTPLCPLAWGGPPGKQLGQP